MSELFQGPKRVVAEFKSNDTVTLPSASPYFAVRSFGLTDGAKFANRTKTTF